MSGEQFAMIEDKRLGYVARLMLLYWTEQHPGGVIVNLQDAIDNAAERLGIGVRSGWRAKREIMEAGYLKSFDVCGAAVWGLYRRPKQRLRRRVNASDAAGGKG